MENKTDHDYDYANFGPLNSIEKIFYEAGTVYNVVFIHNYDFNEGLKNHLICQTIY